MSLMGGERMLLPRDTLIQGRKKIQHTHLSSQEGLGKQKVIKDLEDFVLPPPFRSRVNIFADK